MDSISVASAISPLSWELSVFPDLIRLNVGQVSVLELWAGCVAIYVHGDLAAEVVPGCKQYTEWADYAAIPRSNQRWQIPLRVLPRLSARFRSAHHRLVELAASNKPRSPFMRAHSPGMVAVVEMLTQTRLPERSALPSDQESGSCFGGPEENREIEQLAIDAVARHYKAAGWLVESVERKKIGYDLLCRKAKKELHVEVKGASARTECFLLTAGEFRVAFSDDAFVLALVDNIAEDPRIRQWSAKDFRRSFDFDAVQYWACLRGAG